MDFMSQMSQSQTNGDYNDDDRTVQRKRRRVASSNSQETQNPNNGENNHHQPESMTKALGISLIMDRITKYMTFQDHQNASLVSRLWNTIFCPYLDKWSIFCIHFDMRTRLKITVEERIGLRYKIVNNFGSFKKLEAKLNSTPLKILSITVSSFEKLDVNCKNLVSHLSPFIVHCVWDCQLLNNAIQLLTPLHNLEYLHIKEAFFRPCENFPKNNFPKLKVLHLGESYLTDTAFFMKDFLTAAPNLIKLIHFPLHSIKTIVDVPEVHSKVSSILYKDSLKLTDPDLIALGQLVSFRPRIQLHELKIDLVNSFNICSFEIDFVEACEIFTTLLFDNQNSLENLQLYPLTHDHQLKFPVLANLSTLEFFNVACLMF